MKSSTRRPAGKKGWPVLRKRPSRKRSHGHKRGEQAPRGRGHRENRGQVNNGTDRDRKRDKTITRKERTDEGHWDKKPKNQEKSTLRSGMLKTNVENLVGKLIRKGKRGTRF